MNKKQKSAVLTEAPMSPIKAVVSKEETKSSLEGDNLWGVRNL